MLRIHDILVWIWIPDTRIHASDKSIRIRIRIRILLSSSLTLKMPTKNYFWKKNSAYYFLKVLLHYFSKEKSQKEIKNSGNQSFYYYFCITIKGSGSIPLTNGSGSIPLTNGSGSRRPKNTWIRWIRIRIRNTALRWRMVKNERVNGNLSSAVAWQDQALDSLSPLHWRK